MRLPFQRLTDSMARIVDFAGAIRHTKFQDRLDQRLFRRDVANPFHADWSFVLTDLCVAGVKWRKEVRDALEAKDRAAAAS